MNRFASLRRQRGAGLFGWTAIALMAGTLGLMGLRLVPLYIDYFQILDVAKKIASDPINANKSKAELRKITAQRLRQNNLYDTKPTVLQFKKINQSLVVIIDYEERVNFFANIDLAVKFSDQVYP